MESIRLLFGANDAYAMPMTVAAHSALVHLDRRYHVELHVLDDGISPGNRRRAERILQGSHPRVDLIWRKAELEQFAGVNVRHYSAASMIRIMLPYLFGPEVKRVLYLDSDLIVDDDISSLWDIDLGEEVVWAVQNGDNDDFDNLVRNKFEQVKAPPDARYFNSGVLLVNLPQWRKQNITGRAIDFLQNHSEMLSFPDQDTLNAILAGKWGRLPARWNKQITRIGQTESAPMSERGILHFTSYKPWNTEFNWPGKIQFHKAYLRSGWESPLRAWISVAGLLAKQTYFQNKARILRRLKAG